MKSPSLWGEKQEKEARGLPHGGGRRRQRLGRKPNRAGCHACLPAPSPSLRTRLGRRCQVAPQPPRLALLQALCRSHVLPACRGLAQQRQHSASGSAIHAAPVRCARPHNLQRAAGAACSSLVKLLPAGTCRTRAAAGPTRRSSAPGGAGGRRGPVAPPAGQVWGSRHAAGTQAGAAGGGASQLLPKTSTAPTSLLPRVQYTCSLRSAPSARASSARSPLASHTTRTICSAGRGGVQGRGGTSA